MEIQIIIPWGNHANLGATYNRLMETVSDWVCFLDHDILNLNPAWYHMCLNAVQTLGHRAGWITGRTNAIACPAQFCQDAPKNHDIMEHMKFAKQKYEKHGGTVKLIDYEKSRFPFSGFMILTHKQAWIDTGGFENGFLGVDNYYFEALVKNGYKPYVMPGLYMYHIYTNKRAWSTI